MISTLKTALFIFVGWILFPIVSFAIQETSDSTSYWFYIIQGTFFVLVFLGYPLFCRFTKQNQSSSLKGLNLPQGSVRAMIAISIIGSYLITLSVGTFFIEKEIFNMILTAFGSLSGAVIGFYFGSGGSGGSK